MPYQDCIEERTGWKVLTVNDVRNIFREQHIYGGKKKRVHTGPKCREKTSEVSVITSRSLKISVPSDRRSTGNTIG